MHVCIYIFYIFIWNLIAMSRGFVSGGERYSFFVLRDAETTISCCRPCSRLWLIVWTCPRRPQSSYSGNARLARCLGRFGKSVSEVRGIWNTFRQKVCPHPAHRSQTAEFDSESSWYMLVAKCHCWCNLQVLRSRSDLLQRRPNLKRKRGRYDMVSICCVDDFSALLQL